MPNEDEIQGEWSLPPVGEDILKELKKIQPETYDQEIAMLQVRATVLLAQQVQTVHYTYGYFHA